MGARGEPLRDERGLAVAGGGEDHRQPAFQPGIQPRQ